MGISTFPTLTKSISERSILRELGDLAPFFEDGVFDDLPDKPPVTSQPSDLLVHHQPAIDLMDYFDAGPPLKREPSVIVSGDVDFSEIVGSLAMEPDVAPPSAPCPVKQEPLDMSFAVKQEPLDMSNLADLTDLVSMGYYAKTVSPPLSPARQDAEADEQGSSSDTENVPASPHGGSDTENVPASPNGRPKPSAISKRKRSRSMEQVIAGVLAEAPTEPAEPDEPHFQSGAFQWEACASCRSVKQVCKVQSGTETLVLHRPPGGTATGADLGLQLGHIPFAQFGLVISEAPAPGTSAALEGLELGDVILSIDGCAVNSTAQAMQVLAECSAPQVVLRVERPQTCARCTKMGKDCARAHALKKSFTSCACCTDPKVKKRCTFSKSNLVCDRCSEQGTTCTRSLGDTSKKQRKKAGRGKSARATARRVQAPVQMNLRI